MVPKALFWGGLVVLALGAGLFAVAAAFYLGGPAFVWIAGFEQSRKPVMQLMAQESASMQWFAFYVSIPAIILLLIGAAIAGLGFTRRRSETMPPTPAS